MGCFYMLAAALCFSVMNIMVRLAAADLPPLEVAFFRNVVAFAVILPWAIREGAAEIRSRRPSLHMIRAVVGTFAMGLWFTSLAVVPLADAVALNFTLPLFLVALAVVFLGEDVGARRWIATAIGFIGMLVILRPGFTDITLFTLLPVIAAVFMALSLVTLKVASAYDRPGTSVLYMNMLMTPTSLVPALFVWQWPQHWETGVYVVVLGVCGSLAHLFLARSYQYADASAVMPLDYTRLPLIALMAYLMFGEMPDAWTWAGAAIIAGAAIYIARREVVVSKQKQLRTTVTETPLERP